MKVKFEQIEKDITDKIIPDEDDSFP